MNLNSKANSGLELFLEHKQKYRSYAKNMSLIERLRQLEALQAQSYEILCIREANGGKPVPLAWQVWAKAQEELKK